MDHNHPLASIIVVTFNSEAFIERCLESLSETTYSNYEVVLVDNNSSDTTREILSHYSQTYTILKNDENYGFAGGVNRGVAIAKGEYIVLLNPDCVVTPDWLRHLLQPLRFGCVGATGASLLYPDGDVVQSAGGSVNNLGFTKHYHYGETFNPKSKILSVDYVTGAAFATKRDLLEHAGGLDENYYPVYFEETDYCSLLREAGYHILYVPQSVVYHTESQSVELFSDNYYYWYHSGRLRYVLKQAHSRYTVLGFLVKECIWCIVFYGFGVIKAFVTFNASGVVKKKRSLTALFRAYRDTFGDKERIVLDSQSREKCIATFPEAHVL